MAEDPGPVRDPGLRDPVAPDPDLAGATRLSAGSPPLSDGQGDGQCPAGRREGDHRPAGVQDPGALASRGSPAYRGPRRRKIPGHAGGAAATSRSRPLHGRSLDEFCPPPRRPTARHERGAAAAATLRRRGLCSGADRRALVTGGRRHPQRQGLPDQSGPDGPRCDGLPGALARCGSCPLRRSCAFSRTARQGSRRPLP
jgi:hypothetical protein